MSLHEAPLILTLVLDDTSQAFFDRARELWFPPRLNFIRAHVTMFHHLPGAQLASIRNDLASVCAGQFPVKVAVTGLRSLGRGVAYTLRTPEIEGLRSRLAGQWRDDLTAQDRQGWRPHVTVQNKVSPTEAKATLERLSGEFVPFMATATGVALWRYLGGPWEEVAVLAFAG
ncbi:2'-5' RNA ligase family protein [Acidisoma sp.]|uniref:2'-5' RNA ligase family protein n=1 Tax=Acidisoma sp. TaxID=1872115 RepID=UPI003B00B891